MAGGIGLRAAAWLVAVAALAGCVKHESWSVQGELGEGASFSRMRDLQRDLAAHHVVEVKVHSGTGGWTYTVGFATEADCLAALPEAANLTYVESAHGCFYGAKWTA